MDVYIAFTKKEGVKIEEWKASLPKAKGRRTFNISFTSMDEQNKDNRLLFKAVFKSSDGHKLLLTRKAVFHT